MTENLYITHHDALHLVADETPIERYRAMGLNYPRFFKMDNLCKLGYLCASQLLDEKCDNSRTSMILVCSSSSLDSDLGFQKTIHDWQAFFPSPSLFVYTLANVVMGELAIAYGIRGENTMFVAEQLSQTNLETLVRQTFAHSDTRRVLCGWIEYSPKARETLLMTVQREPATTQLFTTENILKLYEK